MEYRDYCRYDALGLRELIINKFVSVIEVIEAAIARANAVNPSVNAINYTLFDSARAQVKQAMPTGTFAGVPFLIKDLTEMQHVPTSYGSRFSRSLVAKYDHDVVRYAREAGFVIIGKTNTPELGTNVVTEPAAFGATRNPWDQQRTPGGSSGGSAAAVASGMVPMAHASDGGGSIRIPASCCGLFGLKPTRGRSPSGPYGGRGWQGLAVQHVISRSVRDSAAMLDIMARPDLGAPFRVPPPAHAFIDSLQQPLKPLRIGLVTVPIISVPIDHDCLIATTQAAQLCESLGHYVEPTTIKVTPNLIDHGLILVASEVAAQIAAMTRYIERKPGWRDLELPNQVFAQLGKHCSGAELAQAIFALDQIGRQMATLMQRYDVLLTPTLAKPPLPIGGLDPNWFESALLHVASGIPSRYILRVVTEQIFMRAYSFSPFTMLFNISGQPAMSVPLHWNQQGLPIGVQFAAAVGDEATLLQLARQLEHAKPWFKKSVVG